MKQVRSYSKDYRYLFITSNYRDNVFFCEEYDFRTNFI